MPHFFHAPDFFTDNTCLSSSSTLKLQNVFSFLVFLVGFY